MLKRKEKQRDSLLENMDSPYNPFELLQTIDIDKARKSKSDDDADEFRDDNPFAVSSKPRRSEPNPFGRKQNKSSKPIVSSKKRLSAPPKTLLQQTNQEDLLDLFGSAFNNNTNNNNNNNDSNKQPDPFSVFEPRPTPQLQNNSSVNSVTTEELFDVSMWGFDSSSQSNNNNNKRQSNPHIKSLQKHKPDLAPLSEEKSSDDDDDDNSDSDSSVKEMQKKFDKSSKGEKRRQSEPPQQFSNKTNALTEMYRGTALLKYPRRHGFPHFKHVQLSRDNLRLQWFSKRKGLNDTCIYVKDMREILHGQKTEVFKKFRQDLLEKASFSIVYGHDYKTLDVVAKSTDECDMWVNALRQLVDLDRAGTDLTKVTSVDVGVKFKDRNRPKSRRGSGNFIRANNSRQLKIDPIALKQVEREMEQLHKNYHRVAQLAQKPNITRSNEFHNIQQVLSELEERIEELSHEVQNTRDTEMSKRDVWRANVDLTAIQEKVEVLIKYYNSNGRPK